MREAVYRWRCTYTQRGGPSAPLRDVYARTEEGARRTALWAERMVNPRARGLRVASCERLFQVGWTAPEPGQYLFPPVEGVEPTDCASNTRAEELP